MRRLAALSLSLGLLFGMAGGPMAQPASAASLKICGEVTVYVKATLLATGLLTINGVPLVIEVGTVLPASVEVGADICVDLTTNPLGLITGAAVTANVHAEVKVCGVVQAYTAATALATGSLRIGGHTYTLGLGSSLPASVDVGDDLCLDLELDGFGRVADGTVTANAHVKLKVCGTVTAYTEATATTAGLLKVGSKTWTLAVLSSLPATVDVGADICIELELDGHGHVSDGEVAANVETSVRICGTVAAYTAATASALGQLNIAGHTWVVALATQLPASVQAGADLCLDLSLNGFLQVKDGDVTANVEGSLEICGTVTAYAAATATTLGQLKVAGRTLVMALDADLPASVRAGADLCLDLTLNGFLQVKDGTAVANVESTLEVCGQVTAYVAATPTADGSLTIAGILRKVRAGADVDAGVAAGAYLKLRLTTDVFARIAKATVVKVGVSVNDACSDAVPDASQEPGSSSDPGSSQEPGSSNDPGSSQDPGSSPAPDSSHEPGASGPPAGDIDSCVDGGVGTIGRGSGDDTFLPSTDALGRATGVIASNAIPLLAIGLLGALGAWYRSRRRQEEYALAEGMEPEAVVSNAPDASSHDEASEGRP